MKVAALCCLLLVLAGLAVVGPAVALAQGSTSQERMRSASTGAMAYCSVLLSVFILVFVPGLLLMFITKIVGIEEVGFVRCIYLTMIFFAAAALVFYSAPDLENAIGNPGKFFQVTELLIRLGIVFVVAFLLIKFLMAAAISRSLIATILYIVVFYGAAYIAYQLLAAADGIQVLKSGLEGQP